MQFQLAATSPSANRLLGKLYVLPSANLHAIQVNGQRLAA